jgi:hypothetical protein
MTKKQRKLLESDEILVSLKERYFKLASREIVGKNKDMSQTIDNLEIAIRKRQNELLNPPPKERNENK